MLRRYLFVLSLLFLTNFTSFAQDAPPRDAFVPFALDDLPELAPITPENAAHLQLLSVPEPGFVIDIQWSPRGDVLAVVTHIGAWLYDASDFNAPPRLLQGMNKIEFSPDGETLAASAYLGQTVYLWDTDTGTLRATLSDAQWPFTFSADSGLIAAASRPDLTNLSYPIGLWDAATGERLSTLEGHDSIIYQIYFSPVFSPDGARLLTTTFYSGILWDISEPTNPVQKRIIEHRIDDVTMDSDDMLATVIVNNDDTGTHEVQIIDVFSGEGAVVADTQDEWIFSAEFVEDTNGLALVTRSNQMLRLWDLIDQQEITQFPDNNSFVVSGTRIAVQEDTTLRLLDLEGQEIFSTDADEQVRYVALSTPNLVFSDGYEVRLRNLIASEMPEIVLQAAQTDNDSLLVSAQVPDDHARALLEEVSTNSPIPLSSAVFSPNGEILATSMAALENDTMPDVAAHSIELWDVESGELLDTLDGHMAAVTGLAFSPDGELLASGGGEMVEVAPVGTLRLWQRGGSDNYELSATYQFDRFQNRVTDLTFSPDGQHLALIARWADSCLRANDQVLLVDVQTGEYETIASGYITSLAYSPDGALIAIGAGDDRCVGTGGYVSLYDTAANQIIAELPHTIPITAMTFNEDGTALYTLTEDGAIQVWGMPATS